MNIPGRVPDVSIDFHGDCTGIAAEHMQVSIIKTAILIMLINSKK